MRLRAPKISFRLDEYLDYFIPRDIRVRPDWHRRARMFMLSHTFGPFLGNVRAERAHLDEALVELASEAGALPFEGRAFPAHGLTFGSGGVKRSCLCRAHVATRRRSLLLLALATLLVAALEVARLVGDDPRPPPAAWQASGLDPGRERRAGPSPPTSLGWRRAHMRVIARHGTPPSTGGPVRFRPR